MLLMTATNEQIKTIAAKLGLTFTDEDCDELRKQPAYLTTPDETETVEDALADFIAAYEY